jgi:hypothetical protein
VSYYTLKPPSPRTHSLTQKREVVTNYFFLLMLPLSERMSLLEGVQALLVCLLLRVPLKMKYCVEHSCSDADWGKWKYSERNEICVRASLFTKHPTWIGLVSNPGNKNRSIDVIAVYCENHRYEEHK